MKKIGIRILKILGILVLILLVAGFFGYRYIGNSFLDFEGKYAEQACKEEEEVQNHYQGPHGLLPPSHGTRHGPGRAVKKPPPGGHVQKSPPGGDNK